MSYLTPTLWVSGDKFRQVQSDTPDSGNGEYANNLGASGTAPWSRSYTKDGAKLVRVCLDNFDVEYRYDWVEIRDANESIIQVLTGTLGNICSSWVAGNTLKIYLFSDSSVGRIGFSSATLEWMTSPEIRARLPGQWYEKDTEARDGTGLLLYAGLHYNWHRYYDSDVGRYISSDPLGLKAGMNPYLYVSANPINAIDFYGLETEWTHWKAIANLGKYSERIASFSAGLGDSVLMIPYLGKGIRKMTGADSLVSTCSPFYSLGVASGVVLSLAITLGSVAYWRSAANALKGQNGWYTLKEMAGHGYTTAEGASFINSSIRGAELTAALADEAFHVVTSMKNVTRLRTVREFIHKATLFGTFTGKAINESAAAFYAGDKIGKALYYGLMQGYVQSAGAPLLIEATLYGHSLFQIKNAVSWGRK